MTTPTIDESDAAPIDERDAATRDAAHDLLNALTALAPWPDYCWCLSKIQRDTGHSNECLLARAAIAKAFGRTELSAMTKELEDRAGGG